MVLVLLIQMCCFPVWASFVSAQVCPENPVAVPASFPESMSLTGMKLDLSNPLRIKFYLNPPAQVARQSLSKVRITRQIEYFLTALTVPESHQWVNLSPLEKNRIITEEFGQTHMGQALLEQDRRLKLLSSFLLNPSSGTGKRFWKALDDRLRQEYGTTDIPMDFAHKVWIVPDRAVFYSRGSEVYLTDAHMKVLLDSDYSLESGRLLSETQDRVREIFCELFREIVLPFIEREVNIGASFVELRRIYQSMALAAWYKRAVKNGDLTRRYRDRSITEGIAAPDPFVPEKVFQRYVRHFSSGAFDRVYEGYDLLTGDVLPRKYFSGGWSPAAWPQALVASAVAPGFLSAQVEVDASMQANNESVSAKVLSSFRPINGPQELSIDIEGIRASSVSVWLRRSLWARTMHLFQGSKWSGIRWIEKELTLQMGSSRWRSVAQMIARQGKASDVYRNEMTAAILAVDARKMNFWTIFQGLLTARLRIEWLERRWNSEQSRTMRQFGLAYIQGKGGEPYSSVSTEGRYSDLYWKLNNFFARKGFYQFWEGNNQRESDFRIGTYASNLRKVFSSEQIQQLVKEGSLEEFYAIKHEARYINTDKTPDEVLQLLNRFKQFGVFRQKSFLGHTDFEQIIIFDKYEDYFYLIYSGLKQDILAIMQELEKVWSGLLMNNLSIDERNRALADFEWLFYQINPLMRGGAALGTAFSVVARLALGMPLPETFVAQDQIALSEERDVYIKMRSQEFAETVNSDPVGGIDMNPSSMGIDTFSVGEGVFFQTDNVYPGSLSGMRPIIVDIK